MKIPKRILELENNLSPGEMGVYKFYKRLTQRPEHLLLSFYDFQSASNYVYKRVNKVNRTLTWNVF